MVTKKVDSDLPPNVKESDTKYPKSERGIGYREAEEMGIPGGSLTFYRTTGFGWVITTLHISNPSKRQAAGTLARFYGVTMDGKVVRVGRGPHVTAEIRVWLSKDNVERLRPYIDLRNKGLADAGQIRDRISSRRAQGQLHRAAGHLSWDW